jgi:chromosome condensin MukBEF ATPase and DNA-binding subunit MukB
MTPKAVWNAALERARKELPNIYSIISEGKYGGYRDGCYYLSFSNDKQFFISFMMAEDRRKQVESILSDIGAAPARFEAVKEQDAAKEQDVKEKARQDIQALSEVFGRQNIIVTGLDGE